MKNMKKIISLILVSGIILICQAKIYAQTINLKTQAKMDTIKRSENSERVLIDKFLVPQTSKNGFDERMNINRNFLKTLPGFIEDKVYERTDEIGDFICITVAVWKSEDAIKKAKEAVQASYQKEGFDMQAMLKRLNITFIDRGVYKKIKD